MDYDTISHVHRGDDLARQEITLNAYKRADGMLVICFSAENLGGDQGSIGDSAKAPALALVSGGPADHRETNTQSRSLADMLYPIINPPTTR